MRVRRTILLALTLCIVSMHAAWAQGWPKLNRVEVQPLSAQVERVMQALELAGSPLSKEQQAGLKSVLYTKDVEAATEQIQKVLDPQCLVAVTGCV
jgi:hypothetical protein